MIFLQVPGKMSDPLASPSLPSDGSVGEVVTQSERTPVVGIWWYLYVFVCSVPVLKLALVVSPICVSSRLYFKPIVFAGSISVLGWTTLVERTNATFLASIPMWLVSLYHGYAVFFHPVLFYLQPTSQNPTLEQFLQLPNGLGMCIDLLELEVVL